MITKLKRNKTKKLALILTELFFIYLFVYGISTTNSTLEIILLIACLILIILHSSILIIRLIKGYPDIIITKDEVIINDIWSEKSFKRDELKIDESKFVPLIRLYDQNKHKFLDKDELNFNLSSS